MDGTVLIADDDRTIRTVLTQAFTRAGCKVHATASLLTLARWVEDGMGDLVVTDVMMPDGNGLTALPNMMQLRPDLPFIVISAQNTVVTAVRANEAQAYHYLPKPFDLPELLKHAKQALSDGSLHRSSGNNDPAPNSRAVIGETPVMQQLYAVLARVVNTDLPVLITGESGTGKSLIARTLHDLSSRHGGPFETITAYDLEEANRAGTLMQQATGGTVVLEELGDLSAAGQTRLVRLLDTQTDDSPRIVATSQADLTAAMADGQFRDDLFYRLSGVTLPVPPLRDRCADIPLLAQHFMAQTGGALRQLNEEAAALLRTQSWPGNVRQLENTLKAALVIAPGDTITAADLEQALDAPTGTSARSPASGPISGHRTLANDVAGHLRRYFDQHGTQLPPPGLYQRILHEIEKPLIEIALDATSGNQMKSADLLGINRNTLRKKITELDIRVTRGRKLM